jgi:NADH:ubiquinone oxidoreductase subunit 3 (subunit A)
MNLVVAFVITIASWIGYHTSANRPRFSIQFINIELFKLILDVGMVFIYFMLAAYGARQIVNLRPETLLVLVAFGLYLCWDLLSAWQKRDSDNNKYRCEWAIVQADRSRTDVTQRDEWTPTDWGRVAATAVSTLAAFWVWAVVWLQLIKITAKASILVDVTLIVIVIGYRLLKEIMARRRPSGKPSLSWPGYRSTCTTEQPL